MGAACRRARTGGDPVGRCWSSLQERRVVSEPISPWCLDSSRRAATVGKVWGQGESRARPALGWYARWVSPSPWGRGTLAVLWAPCHLVASACPHMSPSWPTGHESLSQSAPSFLSTPWRTAEDQPVSWRGNGGCLRILPSSRGHLLCLSGGLGAVVEPWGPSPPPPSHVAVLVLQVQPGV